MASKGITEVTIEERGASLSFYVVVDDNPFNVVIPEQETVIAQSKPENTSSQTQQETTSKPNNEGKNVTTTVKSKVYYNCNNAVQPVGNQWKKNPQANEDYLNNLYYLMVAGNYQYVTSVDKYDWKMAAEEYKPYFAAHCDLMDYLPYDGITFYFNAGDLLLCYDVASNVTKVNNMVDLLNESRVRSADMYQTVHKKYSFTAKTDIVEILNRYLGESYSYAPSATCGLNNVLDLENIEAYGLIVKDTNGNEHLVSYVPVDGTEYIVELNGSNKGVYKLSEIESKLNCSPDAASLVCTRSEAKKGYFDTRLRPEYCDSIKIKTLPSGDAGYGVTYKELAKFYTGNENISYISNPVTQEDHYNNIQFLLLTAQYDYRDIKITNSNQFKWVSEVITSGRSNYNNDINKNIHTKVRFSPLLAPFANGTGDVVVYYDGTTYHVSTGYFPISYFMQPHEYLREISEVYKLAKTKYNDFRKQGLITSTSTEYEITKVYGDWFLSLGNTQIEREDRSDIYNGSFKLNHIESFYTATPYAGLITRNAQCAGRSATMVVLLRMEGITTYGVHCGILVKNDHASHVVPWMLLDGKEYVFEYAGKKGICTINKENMSAPDCGNLFQEYSYNLILKEAGLEYSEESLTKTYMDSKGNALTN